MMFKELTVLLLVCCFVCLLECQSINSTQSTTAKPVTNKPAATTKKPAVTSPRTTVKPTLKPSNTSTVTTAKPENLTDKVAKLEKETRLLVNDVISLKKRIGAAVAFFDDRIKVTTSGLDKKFTGKVNALNGTSTKQEVRIGSMESDVREIKLVIAEYLRKILHYHGVN